VFITNGKLVILSVKSPCFGVFGNSGFHAAGVILAWFGGRDQVQKLRIKRLIFNFNAAKGTGRGWQKYLWVSPA